MIAPHLPAPLRAMLEGPETGGDPLVSLVVATQLRSALDSYIYESIVSLRSDGATWDDLAGALGITRQGVAAIVKRRRAM